MGCSSLSSLADSFLHPWICLKFFHQLDSESMPRVEWAAGWEQQLQFAGKNGDEAPFLITPSTFPSILISLAFLLTSAPFNSIPYATLIWGPPSSFFKA